MIQNVNNKSGYVSPAAAAAAEAAKLTAAKATTEGKADDKLDTKLDGKTDAFVKGNETSNSGVYQKPVSQDKLTLDQLRVANDARIESFHNMLSQMLGVQVKSFNKATFANLTVTDAQRTEAQKSIADGGEWSPDAVSGRILDMAKALSGGDASKLELLKDAVKKGFGEAEKQWGGKLPEITDRTYEKVMQGFDAWEKEAAGSTTVKE